MEMEEVYVRLISKNKIPSFPPEFLQNYRFAEAYLKRFNHNNLNKKQRANLNKDALANMLLSPDTKILKYKFFDEFPSYVNDISIIGANFKRLNGLKKIDRLCVDNSKIESIEVEEANVIRVLNCVNLISMKNLKKVKALFIERTAIQTLESLEEVETLSFTRSRFIKLPKLQTADRIFVDYEDFDRYKNYLSTTGRSHLIEKLRWS